MNDPGRETPRGSDSRAQGKRSAALGNEAFFRSILKSTSSPLFLLSLRSASRWSVPAGSVASSSPSASASRSSQRSRVTAISSPSKGVDRRGQGGQGEGEIGTGGAEAARHQKAEEPDGQGQRADAGDGDVERAGAHHAPDVPPMPRGTLQRRAGAASSSSGPRTSSSDIRPSRRE